jgi:hypothetical protein
LPLTQNDFFATLQSRMASQRNAKELLQINVRNVMADYSHFPNGMRLCYADTPTLSSTAIAFLPFFPKCCSAMSHLCHHENFQSARLVIVGFPPSTHNAPLQPRVLFAIPMTNV